MNWFKANDDQPWSRSAADFVTRLQGTVSRIRLPDVELKVLPPPGPDKFGQIDPTLTAIILIHLLKDDSLVCMECDDTLPPLADADLLRVMSQNIQQAAETAEPLSPLDLRGQSMQVMLRQAWTQGTMNVTW